MRVLVDVFTADGMLIGPVDAGEQIRARWGSDPYGCTIRVHQLLRGEPVWTRLGQNTYALLHSEVNND